MVEIYVSWCKGISDNNEALEMIKRSDIIDGIETSELEDIDKLKKSGIKSSIHRPFRWKGFNLEEKDAPNYNEEEILKYNNSDAPVLGFHLIDYKEKQPENNKVVLNNIINNLKKFEKLFSKSVVFELQPYDSYLLKTRGEGAEFLTGKEIIKDILKNTNSGMLLDISHTYVSGMNKIQKGKYKGTIEEYFKEILEVSRERIFQLHINVPVKKEEGYEDAHKTFEDNQMSKKIINLIKLVLPECKNLKLITLEVRTNLSSLEHVKKTVEQTEKLNRELGLKKNIKIPFEK